MDKQAIERRIAELLSGPSLETGSTNYAESASELVQSTITLLSLIYGPKSAQLLSFESQVQSARGRDAHIQMRTAELRLLSLGTLRALQQEVKLGLVGNLRLEVTGEVLSDFLLLAQSSLNEGSEDGKNVSAVLTAAAFEDLIRRMGSSFCGIQTREDLSKVVIALKNAGVLVGAQFGTVQAQLQFRNDALHADWQKIDVVGIKTVIALVQELLLKHFS